MTCSDVERILPDMIDGDDPEFRAHILACPYCSELVADLKLIVSGARELAETEDPPARVWVQISNQLRAEGLIRELYSTAGPRPVAVPSSSRRWSAWWLAPVAAAILAAGSYQLTHRTASQGQSSGPQTAQTAQPAQPLAEQAAPTRQVASLPAARPPRPNVDSFPVEAEVSAPSSDDDAQFLSEVSQRAPGMRATYENQLQAVNREILDTQRYIKSHPGDLDARQYLMETYQQKAMLYQMALDHIQ